MLKSGGGFVGYPMCIVVRQARRRLGARLWHVPLWLVVEAHATNVISADVPDPKFHAAIFGHDDSPVPDMRPEELQQTRRYIIHGDGTVPVRKCWHHPHGTPGVAVLCPSEARG
jgi:hypothetical protein